MLKFIPEDKRRAWSSSMYCEERLHFTRELCSCTARSGIRCHEMFWHVIRARKRLMPCTYKHTYTHMCLYILVGFLHVLCVEVDNNIGIYKLTVFETYFLLVFIFIRFWILGIVCLLSIRINTCMSRHIGFSMHQLVKHPILRNS